MNLSIDPEKFEIELAEALNNLNSPKKLSESGLLSLAMVANYKQQDPSALPYQSLKAVLTDILRLLEIENPDYADILRGRYWEGLSPASMIANARPKQWSEKTFFNYQKKARQEFAALLLQKEQETTLEPGVTAATDIPTQPAQAPATAVVPAADDQKPPAKKFTYTPAYLLFGAVALVLVAVIIAIQATGGLSAQTPTASPAAATPTLAALAVEPSAAPATATAPVDASTATPAPAVEQAPPVVLVCGEGQAPPIPVDGSVDRFLRSEGVSSFSMQNTPGVLNDKVRQVFIDRTGLWIGYFATETNSDSGLGHYDRSTKNLSSCAHVPALAGQNINAIVTDANGMVWVGTEKNGLAVFDGKAWQHYTTDNGLPSNEIYGLTLDDDNNLWVSTWEGVAKFDGVAWTVPYTVQNDTLFNNHVHNVLFDGQGNIWVGHIEKGISRYNQANGEWEQITASPGGLSGDNVRGMVLQKASENAPESIWIATQDGGISQYQDGVWTKHSTANGLPSDRVRAVAVDKLNRVWAATAEGVSYWDANQWVPYNRLDTFSIAFGVTCPDKDCPIDDDHVWTGTALYGLTQSRLPLPKSETPLDVNSVCFELGDEAKVCPELVEDPATGDLTAAYPEPIAPGTQFQVYVTVTPRVDYALEEARGDMLVNIDADDANLFGRWPRTPVRGTVDPGQPFEFVDYDNLFTAPELPEGVQEQAFTSTWRVWRHNRFAGPTIRITFTVKQP